MTVSQETPGEAPCAKRRYHSPARAVQRERTRMLLLGAAVGLVRKGDFRPRAKDIAAIAGTGPGSINKHFGSLELLYRVVAREHPAAVVEAIGTAVGTLDVGRLAWLVMVGKPRELGP